MHNVIYDIWLLIFRNLHLYIYIYIYIYIIYQGLILYILFDIHRCSS